MKLPENLPKHEFDSDPKEGESHMAWIARINKSLSPAKQARNERIMAERKAMFTARAAREAEFQARFQSLLEEYIAFKMGRG